MRWSGEDEASAPFKDIAEDACPYEQSLWHLKPHHLAVPFPDVPDCLVHLELVVAGQVLGDCLIQERILKDLLWYRCVQNPTRGVGRRGARGCRT